MFVCSNKRSSDFHGRVPNPPPKPTPRAARSLALKLVRVRSPVASAVLQPIFARYPINDLQNFATDCTPPRRARQAGQARAPVAEFEAIMHQEFLSLKHSVNNLVNSHLTTLKPSFINLMRIPKVGDDATIINIGGTQNTARDSSYRIVGQ